MHRGASRVLVPGSIFGIVSRYVGSPLERGVSCARGDWVGVIAQASMAGLARSDPGRVGGGNAGLKGTAVAEGRRVSNAKWSAHQQPHQRWSIPYLAGDVLRVLGDTARRGVPP